MIPDLIAQYTGLDPEAVQNVWTVLVTNGVAVTTLIVVRKALAPARAVLRWLRGPVPEATPLCQAVLAALADGATTEGEGEEEGHIKCPARGFLLVTNRGDWPEKISVEGRSRNRWNDLNGWDRKRVYLAVIDFRARLAYRQLRDDTDRLLSYRDPLAEEYKRKCKEFAAPCKPLARENVL